MIRLCYKFNSSLINKTGGAVMGYILYYAISGFVFGFVCNAILKDKGYGTDENPNYGFWWGFVFGVLGLVVCVCKKRLPDLLTSISSKAKIKVHDNEKTHFLSFFLYTVLIFSSIFLLWFFVVKF